MYFTFGVGFFYCGWSVKFIYVNIEFSLDGKVKEKEKNQSTKNECKALKAKYSKLLHKKSVKIKVFSFFNF